MAVAAETEVRFRHGSFVHDFVRDTIRERLMERRPLNTFSPAPLPAPPAQPAVGRPPSEFSQMMANEPPAASGLIDPEAATAAAPPLPPGDGAARITTEPAIPEFT